MLQQHSVLLLNRSSMPKQTYKQEYFDVACSMGSVSAKVLNSAL